MKKLLTLAALVAITATGFAQPRPNNGNAFGHKKQEQRHYQTNHRVRDRDDFRRNQYAFDPRQRDFEIDKIMRNYQIRIDQVNSDWRFKNSAKRQMVRDLVRERDREISFVWNRYNHPQNFARR